MNRILFLLIFLYSIFSYSQSKVDFKFYDVCKDSILSLDYSLQKLDDFDKHYSTYETDSILQIEDGIYLVFVEIPDGENFKNFNFTKNFNGKRFFGDTLELPKVMRKYTSVLHYPTDLGFFNCDKICNGYIVEYYKNGVIRMEGIFKKGLPKKELRKYNKKGELIEIEIYNRKGTYKKSKYPDYENA